MRARTYRSVLPAPGRVAMRDPESVGLCFTCRWARVVTNRRGSVFYRCLRAETDPRFVRYPPLPVRQCDGYTPDTGTEDVERQRQAETSSDDVA